MHRVSIFLLLVLICFSCTKKDKIVDVKNLNNAWNKNQKLVFKFNSEEGTFIFEQEMPARLNTVRKGATSMKMTIAASLPG